MTTTARPHDLRIGELGAVTGVAPDTIRFYEKTALMPRPERSPNGYRAYDRAAVDRLQFIRGAQRLGLTLADIRELLAVRDTGRCPCEPAEQLLSRRIDEVDAEIGRLTALRTEMAAMRDALPDPNCPAPAPGTWRPPGEEVVTVSVDELRCDCCDDPTCPPDECGCEC